LKCNDGKIQTSIDNLSKKKAREGSRKGACERGKWKTKVEETETMPTQGRKAIGKRTRGEGGSEGDGNGMNEEK
jgi:hypothetical protein